jgi:hypothetical protein
MTQQARRHDVDDLSKKLLALVADPNTTMDQLIGGMEALTKQLDRENRQYRRQQRAEVARATPEELRRLANKNLARRYK